MILASARSRLYLGFYELCVPACRRHASSTSAIKKGLRAETSSFDRRRGSRKPWEDRDRRAKPDYISHSKRSRNDFDAVNDARSSGSNSLKPFDRSPSPRRHRVDAAPDHFRSDKFKDRNARPSSKSERRFGERSNGTERTEIRTGQFKSFDRQRSTDGRAEPSTRRDNNFSRMKSSNSNDDQVPVSIPYTTAASVFLYGANPVLAALRGKQRKAYSLLLTSRASNNPTIREILDHAKTLGIKVNEDASPRLLDKMTTAGTESGEPRPHNGVVLEASKLPAPPVLALSVPNKETRRVQLTLDSQSPEERSINGDRSSLRFPSHRQPFVLFVDGITDPGNLGNIIRTAHFYGVDAVAVATNTCAPLTSAVLAKASAGACEAVPIMSLPKPANFIFDSRKAGWQIYAAAPAPTSPATNSRSRADPNAAQKLTTASLQKEKPLVEQPCILMLGAEGEGLRSNLTVKADYFLSIEQGLRESRSVDVGVESLNVSVAAGVLIEALMRQTELTGAQLFRQTQEEKMF